MRAAALSLLLFPLLAPPRAQAAHGPAAARISACFVPEQSCAGLVVAAIAAARREVRVQAYGFTSAPILAALAAAARRGVDVRVILDKSNATGRYSGATYIANAGIPVAIDAVPGIAHNKLIIIDAHLVVGGSYNYTASADRRNVENVTFTDAAEVALWFLGNWAARWAHAAPFRPVHGF